MRAITTLLACLLLSLAPACDDDSQPPTDSAPGDVGPDAPAVDLQALAEAGADITPTPDLPPPDQAAQTDQGPPKTCTPHLSCTTTADCTAIGLLDCVNNTCIQCKTLSDCLFVFKGCSSAGFCQTCTSDADCNVPGAGTGKCDPVAGQCTLCDTDADCASAGTFTTKYCAQIPVTRGPGTTMMCVGCKTDADCASATRKRCDLTTGTCALCKTDADCCPYSFGCGQTCDPATGECGCTTDLQCETGYNSKIWKCM